MADGNSDHDDEDLDRDDLDQDPVEIGTASRY